MLPIGRLLWLIAFDVSVVALVALCAAMVPDLLRRARERAVETPGRSLLIGVINVAFFGLISVALLSAGRPALGLFGAIAGTLLLCLVAVGLAAVAALVGDRLRPDWPDPLRRLLAGALTLTLASSVPLIGWFVVLPLAGLIGCGAAIGALARRPPPPQPPPPGGPPAGGSTSGET